MGNTEPQGNKENLEDMLATPQHSILRLDSSDSTNGSAILLLIHVKIVFLNLINKKRKN